jgi:NADP-dependent 3-hydroxy acid dehydrogenase YdfG
MSVTVSGLDPKRLREAADKLGAAGFGRALTVHADVRNCGDVARMVDATANEFGGLDVLVNNAGVARFAHVADQRIEDWQTVIDTNLTGVFNACHAAIPHLRKRGGGYIINISSLAGKNPFANGAAYCASKAGLNAFSEALMQALSYDDIRVSYILPGSVRTGFAGQSEGPDTDWKIASEDVAQVVVDLLEQNPRSLASRIELRPSKPRK